MIDPADIADQKLDAYEAMSRGPEDCPASLDDLRFNGRSWHKCRTPGCKGTAARRGGLCWRCLSKWAASQQKLT